MERNYSIDKLKILASFAVVFMHVVNYLPTTTFANYWTYDWYFPILDLAVPLFFVFAGYFLKRKNIFQIPQYANKIFVMIIAYNLVYLLIKWPIDMMSSYINGLRGWALVSHYFQPITWWMVLTGIVGSEHLWYLSGLFYASWILIFLLNRKFTPLTIFLLGFAAFILMFLPPFNFLLGNLLLYGGFVKGFFYVSMGYLIATYTIRYPHKVLLLLLSLVVLVVIGSNTSSLILYESLLAVVVFQILIIAKEFPGQPSWLSRFSHYSLGIYLLHIIFTGIFNTVRGFFPGVNALNPLFIVLPMVMICIIGSILLYPLTEKYIHRPLIHLFNRILTKLNIPHQI